MKTESSTSGSTTHGTKHSTTTHSTTKPNPDPKNVVLITGGLSSTGSNATLYSSEIFSPNSPPCILRDLPAPYTGHTQDHGLICGGVYNQTRDNCRQWSYKEGKFPEKPVHQFYPGRYDHVSWTPASEKETFLIGGFDWSKDSQNSSTFVRPGVLEGYKGPENLPVFRLYGACSIPDPETDTVVITGGNYISPHRRVTALYNEDGFVEYLGNMTYPRLWHGCTSYIADKKRV